MPIPRRRMIICNAVSPAAAMSYVRPRAAATFAHPAMSLDQTSDAGQSSCIGAERSADFLPEECDSAQTEYANQAGEQTVFEQGSPLLVLAQPVDQLQHVNYPLGGPAPVQIAFQRAGPSAVLPDAAEPRSGLSRWARPQMVDRAFAIALKASLTSCPRSVTAAIQITAIKPTSIPYSTRAAPASPCRSRS